MLQKTSNIFVKLCHFTAVAALAMNVNFAFTITPAASWSNITVSGINNLGQISCTGTIDGTTRAFLLTLIPETETYAMLMPGLGVMGFATCRRKLSGKSSYTLREVMPARLNVEGA
ncbi:MAG TPA: hypothetical protein VIO87_04375 [Methylotenera sp.]